MEIIIIVLLIIIIISIDYPLAKNQKIILERIDMLSVKIKDNYDAIKVLNDHLWQIKSKGKYKSQADYMIKKLKK